MGKHDFTPAGMKNSHGYPMSWFEDDEEPVVVNVNITQPAQTEIKEVKPNAGAELKELLKSIEGMSEAEKKFAIKAHYGLLSEKDVDSIV